MKFSEGDWCITEIDSINDGFIVITKSFKDSINKILINNRFTLESKFICKSLYGLHVFIDGFGTLGAPFQLFFELLNVAIGWFGISVDQGLPYIMCGTGMGNKRLYIDKNGTKNGTKDEMILSFPGGVHWVWRCDIVGSNCW